MAQPLILDLDDSVRELPEAARIPLGDWQEAVRFGCGNGKWRRFAAHLEDLMPQQYGTVFMGSGDFHHVSTLLIGRCSAPVFDLVVFDNHPDNMRFPWGIHCGSWVKHVATLDKVRSIHVVGMTSGDIGLAHAWENHLRPFLRGKLHYWSIGPDTRWLAAIGRKAHAHRFADADTLTTAFSRHIAAQEQPVYLSIDKDVLAQEEAHTNWDQGCLRVVHLEAMIAAMRGRVVASDITGEVSQYRYSTAWKRWLSALDAQPEIASKQLDAWQAEQARVNERLLASIGAAERK